jgi:hypothetical protein
VCEVERLILPMAPQERVALALLFDGLRKRANGRNCVP